VINLDTEEKIDTPPKDRRGFSSKVLLISVTVILLGVGVFLYISQLGTGDVQISIEIPDNVKMGQPFEAEVNISNNSSENILESKLTISLPTGIILLDSPDKRNDVRELEEIPNTNVLKEKVRLIAVPTDSDRGHELRASLTYTTKSLSAFFNKNTVVNVSPQNTTFDIDMTVPSVIFSGQEFSSKISLNTSQIESKEEFNDISEKIKYYLILENEDELDLVSSEPKSSFNDLKWEIPITEEKNYELNFVARAVNVSTDVLSLKPRIILNFADENYELDRIDENPLLAPSPLTLGIRLSDPKSYAFAGEELTYIVTLKNNTEVPLRNVIVRTQLIGEMFDGETVDTDGKFNSLDSSIVWSSADFDELSSLGVGRQATFSFAVTVKKDFPISQINDKNFVLKVNVTAESPTITQGVSTDRTSTDATLQTKVAGDLDLKNSIYFDESEYENSGLIPPKEGTKTTLSVHWSVENKGTDVRGVQLRSRLGSNVLFEEVLSSPEGSTIEYDESTRDLFWNLGDLSAGAGIISKDPEAIFKISITPNNSDIGNFIHLMDLVTISATDEFTGISLSGSSASVDTSGLSDSGFDAEDGRVISNE